MVFKKPYAFLIKHFKLIHLVISALLIYLAFKIFKIVRFFSEFASSGYYSATSNIAGSHINIFMYLAVILALCISIFVYMLMKSKKKNTKLYVGLIAYYIFVFVLLSVTFGIMQGLEKEIADAQMARLYRDLSLLFSLPQYFFIIYTALRGLGFNLKQFNFQLDLKEMEIEATDDEEIELTVGVETYKAKRYLRRLIREFRYYILENTFIFICIISIVGLIIGTGLFMNFNVYNKVYKENKDFAYKVFTLRVNNSYITNTGYDGKELIKDKYYLILNMNITNKAAAPAAMDLTDFRLRLSNENIYPTSSKIQYFTDLGTPYKGDKLKSNSQGDYIIIFELDKKQVRKNYTFNILDSYNYKAGELQAKYKKLKVKPTDLTEIFNTGNYKQQDKIDLKDSLLGNSTLKITGYNITNTYKYNYEFCIAENDCKQSVNIVTPNYKKASGSILLVLDYELKLDKESSYYKNNKNPNNFFTHFSKIKYKIDDQETILDTYNVTPADLEDKVVLQVDSQIRQAQEVYLVLDIRNREYNIKIK